MDDQSLTDIGNAALSTIFEDGWEPVSYDEAGPPETGTPPAEVDAGQPEQPRGEDGRFLPKEPEVAETAASEPEESAAEPEETDAGDPEEAAGDDAGQDPVEEDALVVELEEDLLELVNTKYGGDLGKALRGLQEAQSLIGRQGSELGELREVREQMDSLRNLMTLQQQSAGVDWEEVIAENPEEAVMKAVYYQNPQAFDQALEAWAVEEPLKAFQFLQEIQQYQDAPPPTTLDAEMEALKARLPDIQQRLPAIQEAAEKRPALARLLNDQDPRTRAQALEDLYHLSAGAGTPDTSAAARQIVLRAKAEADAAKADAAVVSASNTAPPPAPPVNTDDMLADTLKEYLGLQDDFKIVG